MKYTLLLMLTACFFISCKKDRVQDTPADPYIPYSEAAYKITVTLKWQNPQFTVPDGVHVTTLAGMIHSKDTSLWSPSTLAGTGLKNIAEAGNDVQMNVEMNNIISNGKGLSTFAMAAPAVTGSVEATMNFNTDFSCFSFASMIAPSPDWFMGINGFNLFKDAKWIQDISLPVILYDAGTEEGDIFGYDNPPTVPQQPISLLTPANATVLANGNPVINAIGTIRFLKLN